MTSLRRAGELAETTGPGIRPAVSVAGVPWGDLDLGCHGHQPGRENGTESQPISLRRPAAVPSRKNVAIYRCEADKKLPVVIRLTGSQQQIVS
jgi:hypothetical protein